MKHRNLIDSSVVFYVRTLSLAVFREHTDDCVRLRGYCETAYGTRVVNNMRTVL